MLVDRHRPPYKTAGAVFWWSQRSSQPSSICNFAATSPIAEQVDPIKLNQTLTATAEVLTGLGDRFGESLENGNQILDDLNPQMPHQPLFVDYVWGRQVNEYTINP